MANTNDLYANIEAGKPLILLVDDDPNILDTVKDILEDSGYLIRTAINGAETLKLLDEVDFNVVVVDFQLPDSTGLELARKVREKNADTCVILMTGHASLEMAVKAIQEAIYDYLMKPVDPAHLTRTIEKALEKQRLSLENKQLLADLQQINEAMARLDSLKSNMVAVLSHDLRTPLSSIRGYSELLRSGIKGRLTDEQKRILEITMQEADHINGLIGDLLDLASIDAGRLSLDARPALFDEVIQKAVPRVKLSSEMKEIPLEVVVSTPLGMVQMDVNRMSQVLSNLLRGSLRHAQRGGRVFLNVHQNESAIEVRISHTGQGFTPEQLGRLFSWSSHPVESMGIQDGLRVGLAIAREIVQAHGGEIGVESKGVDQGCTFWFRLPVLKNIQAIQAA